MRRRADIRSASATSRRCSRAGTNADARANNERVLATLKTARLYAGRARRVSERRSQLLHRVHRTRRRVRAAGRHAAAPRASASAPGATFARAQLVTAVDYLQANRRRAVIMQDVARRARGRGRRDVHGADAGFAIESESGDEPDGHPSIAVPNGFASNGTPTAVMFSGQLYREGPLMALANAYEDAMPNYQKQPPGFV